MGKFKVGDMVKVRHTDYEGDGPQVGSVFKVGSALSHGVRPEGEHNWAFFCNQEVELVPAWQPKVGDRVQFNNTKPKNGAHYSPNGLTVFRLRSDQAEVNYDDESFIQVVAVSDLEPLSTTPATLTIEAGKFYKTRDGRKVGPIRARSDSMHPWLSNFENSTGDPTVLIFRADGRNYSRKHLDLVALWEEPTPASYDNAAVAKPKLKVGDIVKRSNGYSPGRTLRITEVISQSNITAEWLDGGSGSTHRWQDYEFELITTPTTPAIVALIENGTPRPSTAPKVHTSQEAATTEAARLALEHPSQQFGVFVLADSKIADEVITKTAVLRAA